MRRRLLSRAPLAAALLCALGASALAAQPAARPAAPELLVRVDDIGMNHSVNMALERVAAMGVPLSASVMFACPWYQEAVDILKRNPHVSVGVHLTLNSEWRGYRWGPVLGQRAVPSLVDTLGYFLPSSAAFLKSAYDLGEVERELSAQVERALRSGLKIDYVDYHMGTAVSTPQLRQVVERVAAKYELGISRYFGEAYRTMFDTPIADKQRDFMAHLGKLAPGSLNLVVVHMAEGTPEMMALVDMNNATQNTAGGDPLVGRHRQAELDMLLSQEFARLRASGGVTLVNYGAVIARKGRAAMRRAAAAP
jgi:chitin disaccharide deacetylase